MNSCFHGDAVIHRQAYCNPVLDILDAETGIRSSLQIEGRIKNSIPEKQRRWCLTERDRFTHPYTMKPMKRAHKTVFKPQVPVIENGNITSKPVPPKTKKRSSLFQQ